MVDGEVPLAEEAVVGAAEVDDLLDGQLLVERDRDLLHVPAEDAPLAARGHVSQVPDRDGVHRWAVLVSLDGEDGVDLALGFGLGSELGCRDSVGLGLTWRLLVGLGAFHVQDWFLLLNNKFIKNPP